MAGPLGAEGAPEFIVKVRGDTLAQRAAGLAADAFQAVARDRLAAPFCRRRGLQTTFRSGITLHGPEQAGALCRVWCHEVQFLFDLELASPLGGASFLLSPPPQLSWRASLCVQLTPLLLRCVLLQRLPLPLVA